MDVGCQVYKLKPEAHTQAAAPPKGAERIKTTWGYPRATLPPRFTTSRHAASVYHEPPCRHSASLQSLSRAVLSSHSRAWLARAACAAPYPGLWQVPAPARA